MYNTQRDFEKGSWREKLDDSSASVATEAAKILKFVMNQPMQRTIINCSATC